MFMTNMLAVSAPSHRSVVYSHTSTAVTGKWTQFLLLKGTQMIYLLLHMHQVSCIHAFRTILRQHIIKAHFGNRQLAIV